MTAQNAGNDEDDKEDTQEIAKRPFTRDNQAGNISSYVHPAEYIRRIFKVGNQWEKDIDCQQHRVTHYQHQVVPIGGEGTVKHLNGGGCLRAYEHAAERKGERMFAVHIPAKKQDDRKYIARVEINVEIPLRTADTEQGRTYAHDNSRRVINKHVKLLSTQKRSLPFKEGQQQ